MVDEHNQFKGQPVLSPGIRENTNGLVVGIQRNTESILNPNLTTTFECGDIVWILDEKKKDPDAEQDTVGSLNCDLFDLVDFLCVLNFRS